MVNRNFQIGGIWAKDAPDVPDVPDVPAPSTTYANTLLDELTINKAWPYSEIVTSNNFNELMQRVTLLLTQIENQGILSYSTLTDYVVGSIVLGSDFVAYKALNINGPSSILSDPVGNPGTWKDLSKVVTKVSTSGLATGGDIITEGTIDVPISTEAQALAGSNNTTAMTPLRVRQAIEDALS